MIITEADRKAAREIIKAFELKPSDEEKVAEIIATFVPDDDVLLALAKEVSFVTRTERLVEVRKLKDRIKELEAEIEKLKKRIQ